MLGYYVEEASGKVCSTAVPPYGCHFEFHEKPTYREIWVVADQDGEVLQEAVFWPSLEALAAAGVDISGYAPVQE